MKKSKRPGGGKEDARQDANGDQGVPQTCQDARSTSLQAPPTSGEDEHPVTRDLSRETSKELTDAVSPALRVAYAEWVSKPVPERFVKLLQDLATRDKRAKEPSG